MAFTRTNQEVIAVNTLFPRLDTLFPEIYEELRALAARLFEREAPNHTLQPTAVVHEAYLRLTKQDGCRWQSSTHFYAVASQMVRRALVDHVRRKRAQKRHHEMHPVWFCVDQVVTRGPRIDLIALDEAMDRLEKCDSRKARVVEMRFYGGLTIEEVAEFLRISPRTVAHDWAMAQAWLRRELAAPEMNS